MLKRDSCYVFAGPSLSGELARRCLKPGGFILLPPVSRGDVARLIRCRRPAVVVLADGAFHQSMSVGHAEIREAVERGWSVWGVSSIGAIRAYEMRYVGVRGSGRVFRLFFRFADFQDDELAMLHGPDPPYPSMSEPLVHVRFALAALIREGLLGNGAAVDVLAQLKALWYGDRTLALFRSLVACAAKANPRTRAVAFLDEFDRFRVKRQDLARLLTARPWCLTPGSRRQILIPQPPKIDESAPLGTRTSRDRDPSKSLLSSLSSTSR